MNNGKCDIAFYCLRRIKNTWCLFGNLGKISQSIGLIINKQNGTCTILRLVVLLSFNPQSRALPRKMVDKRVGFVMVRHTGTLHKLITSYDQLKTNKNNCTSLHIWLSSLHSCLWPVRLLSST